MLPVLSLTSEFCFVFKLVHLKYIQKTVNIIERNPKTKWKDISYSGIERYNILKKSVLCKLTYTYIHTT